MPLSDLGKCTVKLDYAQSTKKIFQSLRFQNGVVIPTVVGVGDFVGCCV